MNVSIIIPAQGSESTELALTLNGIFAQRYDAGQIEVFVVQYGDRALPSISSSRDIRLLAVDHPSPYRARNVAAAEARGDVFLFTEPGCVPDAGWVEAHVARMRDHAITISVGRVIGERMSKSADVFMSYEDTRDTWVFSCGLWKHYFGRPKNMAVARRRFETHGPFKEVLRGADSTFVQCVAREVSCNEIAFTPDAIVRQASVFGLPGIFAERFRHARALRIHRSSHAAPIALEKRVALFRETLAANDYGAAEAVKLFVLLGAGILAFRLGGLASFRRSHSNR